MIRSCSRPSPVALRSTSLATLFVAALTVWGCGGGGGGGGETGGAGGEATGGAGGHGTGGGNAGATGKGGAGGVSTTGTGGAATGTGGSTTTGTGGSSATGTGGSSATGTGGSSATGTGGSSATGTGGSSATGTGGSSATGTGGSSATGTGGSSATGSGGGAGAGGAAGSGATCTNGSACTTSAGITGVCGNGTCEGCTTSAACQTAYGSTNTNYVCLVGTGACVAGNCATNGDCAGKICGSDHNCAACTTPGECTSAYGNGYICQTSTGTCVQGSCNTNADCGTGQICSGVTCTSCGTDDSACVSAYGNGYICVSGTCVTGTCHNGADCTGAQAGDVCTASTHTCAACTSDNGCQNSYSAAYICVNNVCVQGNCHDNTGCSNGGVCLNNSCTPCTADGQCAAGQLCLSGGCVTGNCRQATTDCMNGQVCTANVCSPCGADGDCISQYGNTHLCQGGQCVAGNCRQAGDCAPTSQICNTGTLLCGACATDTQCAGEYGAGHICLSGVCVAGNCHDSSTCGGQICSPSHSCTACGVDTDCTNDPTYGAQHLCQNGACISGQCRTAQDCNNTAQICTATFQCTTCSTTPQCTDAYGSNHVCSGGACVSGNCNTSADCGGDQICVGHACVACTTDTQCTGDTTYGAGHICLSGQCLAGNCHNTSADCTGTSQLCDVGTHTCVACASDTACQSDSTYGAGDICLSNQCVAGNCHDTSVECSNGQLCGASVPHTCGACATDTQCTGDSHYGTGDICYQGACLTGNCHGTSTDCTGTNSGLICGVTTPETCGSCTTDSQCQNDAHYGTSFVCDTAAGANAGKCVSAACTPNDATCTVNGADFCCGGSCVAGNCCNNTDCANNPNFGAGYACTGNVCSHCDAISGNVYFVDPVNGNDTSATGSGKSSGAAVSSCSFKTLTRAMQVIGNFAGAGTKVVIVGTAGQTTNLSATEVMPITVQPNVTITNSTGPVTIILPNATSQANPTNVSGFTLSSNGSGISGSTDPTMPLTIDGHGNLSGIAVTVSGASTVATLQNLTIKNTRAHAITVTGGELDINQGLVESGAGVTGLNKDGILISAGVVKINVPTAGMTPTTFSNNVGNGIEVSATGSVNITGVPTFSGSPSVPNGAGTVVVTGNFISGIQIEQTAGMTGLATSTISGLVAWSNGGTTAPNPGDGARFFGWSNINVRKSVFGANVRDGIFINNSANNANGRTVSTIDLGTSGSFGLNWVQTPSGALGRNGSAGVCVNLGAAATGTLNLAGNEMVTGAGNGVEVDCSSATTLAVTKQTNGCTNGSSLSHATGSTVTAVLSNCN